MDWTIPTSLTSPLGRRISMLQSCHEENGRKQKIPMKKLEGEGCSTTTSEEFSIAAQQLRLLQYPPAEDFLRLPPTTTTISTISIDEGRQSLPPSTTTITSNERQVLLSPTSFPLEELERRVLQYHLDAEQQDYDLSSSSSSSLLRFTSSKYFTRIIERDPIVGLGMSLREYNGCIYVQALMQRDGSWLREDGRSTAIAATTTASGGGDDGGGDDGGGGGGKKHISLNAGPGAKAGILPGDRLIGINGCPFLRGRLANDYNYDYSLSSSSRTRALPPSSEKIMESVRDAISHAPSPMVLHMERLADREQIVSLLQSFQNNESNDSNSAFKKKSIWKGSSSNPTRTTTTTTTTTPHNRSRGNIIHKFAKAMSERGIIQKGTEEKTVTLQLRLLTDRTRQWESKLSFRLRANDFTLRPQLDARDVEQSYYASFITDEGECPPFFEYKFSKSLRSYAPSTPTIHDWRLSYPSNNSHPLSPIPRVRKEVTKEAAILADLYAGLDEEDADVQDLLLGGKKRDHAASVGVGGGGAAYPVSARSSLTITTNNDADIFVPLVGVRKAMCVRILNSFLDNRNQTAFTIWCYDVESGREWYAPVRYYSDFKDLRSSLIRLDKSIADIPFPSLGWGGLTFSTEASETTTKAKALRCNQLEIFLRQTFAHIYRGRLHPYIAELAVHLQTFVGCDTVLGEEDDSRLLLSKQVAISESSYGRRMPDPKCEPDITAQRQLKRSIMRYVYRLLMLPVVEKLTTNFINATKDMVLPESSSSVSEQSSAIQGEVRASIEKIRDFIDQLQGLIMDGCHDDFISISQRRDFAALVDDHDNLVRYDLFREAVREQVEIEVYVPLRSTISKYLVFAWLNEDMEMKHKMKALIDKPQSFFRIPKEHRSRSNWESVSRILKEGVGRSTLPSVKLRAVVDAAKEITQLDAEERSVFPETTFFDAAVVPKVKTLGADDFLPIFIYCFVQAKMERPSALCELLSSLCDPAKMNGEVGYYLATFHAALTHIHELDLTEAENDLSIIFDTE